MKKPFVSPQTFPFDHKRFLTATAEMTADEFRAYTLIMIATWRRGGSPLPDDPKIMAKKLRCTEERWLKSIRPGLVVEYAEGEEQLFDLSEGTFRMPEMEELWGFVQKKIAVKQANGKLGGRPPAVRFDLENQNLTAQTAHGIEENQTANPLINKESDKAVGSVSVPFSLSTKNLNLKEESKKESPLPPQGGNGDDFRQIQEPKGGQNPQGRQTMSSATVYRPAEEPAKSLFPLQEIQNAPLKARAPRRQRAKPEPVSEAIFQAYWTLNPPCDDVRRHDEKATRNNLSKAIESGVDPDELIRCWGNYRMEMQAKGKFHTEFIKAAQNFISLREREWLKWQNAPDLRRMKGNVTPLRRRSDQVPDEYIGPIGGRQW